MFNSAQQLSNLTLKVEILRSSKNRTSLHFPIVLVEWCSKYKDMRAHAHTDADKGSEVEGTVPETSINPHRFSVAEH